MTSIRQLLAESRAGLFGPPGDARRARERLPLSQLLAIRYEAYNRLRMHLFHAQREPTLPGADGALAEIIGPLIEQQWIKRLDNSGRRFCLDPRHAGDEVDLYLRGHWLEEYLYCALMHAGVDEGYFSQKIRWGDDKAPSMFEVDALARSGDRLILVSCKAINPRSGNGMSTELRAFMAEALSWDRLLANGRAAVLIATTADFIDERHLNIRFAPILEQAECLGEILIGEEHLPWDTIVPICRSIVHGDRPDIRGKLGSILVSGEHR